MSKQNALFLMVLVTLIWSANGLLIKLVDWPPMAISGLRSLFAAAALLPFIGKPSRWLSVGALAGGTAFAGALITFVIATKLTTAANAIFLQLTAPVYVALFAWWILKERISALDWIVTAVIMGGMLLFFGDNLTTEGFWGNISAILSAVCWAVFVLFYRKERDDAPLKIPLIGHVICVLTGLPFVIDQGWWPTSGGLWIIPMGAVGAGLSFVLYTGVIRRLEAIEAVITQTIEPVFNPVWVFLVVGEKPGPWALLGGGIVLTSITLHAILRRRNQSRLRLMERAPGLTRAG
jgi:drug/metabolite transporter (DMT)-like permease